MTGLPYNGGRTENIRHFLTTIMNQAPHVAIVGATGAVGVEILSCLETRNFPVGSLKLLASARSAGKSWNRRSFFILMMASMRKPASPLSSHQFIIL